MPTDHENNIWEFEPGAANPLFFKILPRKEEDTVILDDVKLKLVITIKKINYEIEGVWDEERQGFSVDTNSWGSVIRQAKLMVAYVYLDWGDGWRYSGYMKLMPMEGATWQRSA